MEYHFVPLEERAKDEKGNVLPWGYVYKEYVLQPSLTFWLSVFHPISGYGMVTCSELRKNKNKKKKNIRNSPLTT